MLRKRTGPGRAACMAVGGVPIAAASLLSNGAIVHALVSDLSRSLVEQYFPQPILF